MGTTNINDVTNIISEIKKMIFSLWRYSTKTKIYKIRSKINNIYEEYEKLNPWFYYLNNKKEVINKELKKQKIFYFLIDKNQDFEKDINDQLDFFSFFDETIISDFGLHAIRKINKNFRILLKKIKKIQKTINKFHYIIPDYYPKNFAYNSFVSVDIIESSISFCPSFDERKLFNPSISTFTTNVNESANLITNYKKKECNEFIKELKSNYFSININFKKSENLENSHSYSLYFMNNKLTMLQVFFSSIDKSEFECIKKDVELEIAWINNVFGLKLPKEKEFYPNQIFYIPKDYFKKDNKNKSK